MRSFVAVSLAGLLTAGCASLQAQVNAPLATMDETKGYRLDNLSSARSSDDLLVVVSFSGGGKRSAAFGYGALLAMREMGLGSGERTGSLLHEIDLLTGVSGGSFPVAIYALHRVSMFQTSY